MSSAGYVFGYGSLAASATAGIGRRRSAEGFVCDLAGFRRGWGVAMDNSLALPGYKRYADASGACPAVFVAFLDIAAAVGSRVNGVCLPVDDDELAALDARERNYERVDVADAIGCPSPVWTYVGSTAGRRRLRDGIARGAAVIDAGYLDQVQVAFQALGAREWARCAPSLAPGGLPVVGLTRVEVEPATRRGR